MQLRLTPDLRFYGHEGCSAHMLGDAGERALEQELGEGTMNSFAELGIETRDLMRVMSILETFESGASMRKFDLSSLSQADIQKLFQSKVFSSLITEIGPIERTQILEIVDPADRDKVASYSDLVDYTLPKGFEEHRRISIVELAKKILYGDCPQKIVYKPDNACLADGIIFIEKNGSELKLSFKDPKDKIATWGRNYSILQELSDSCFEDLSEDDEVKSFKVKISKDNVQDVLKNLAKVLFLALYVHETDIPGEINLEAGLSSGLVEAPINKVAINGKAIEGRYFLEYDKADGLYKLSTGESSVKENSPSFMKHGKEAQFVNYGDRGEEWPDMHDDLLRHVFDFSDDDGFPLYKSKFNAYMEKLLASQAHYYTNKVDDIFRLGGGLKVPKLQIDLVWEEGAFMQVPQADNNGTLVVPRPLVMEMHPC